jgi:lysophospholipase L1-like esterase
MNVLFVGNSFTARNDLPGLIASIAESRGERLDHTLISVNGASLRAHWNKGEARRAIEAAPHDVVVLQEQSTLPVKNAKRFHENVRLFDEVIRASGARTALYLTWARRHAPETQRAITDAYTAIGDQLGALVVPAGVAWERVRATHERPELYDRDGSHPSAAGSYLAACVFFRTLFGKSPVGAAVHGGVAPAEARLLQETAA